MNTYGPDLYGSYLPLSLQLEGTRNLHEPPMLMGKMGEESTQPKPNEYDVTSERYRLLEVLDITLACLELS